MANYQVSCMISTEVASNISCRVCGTFHLSPLIRGQDRLIGGEGHRFVVSWCEECRCGTTQITPDESYWNDAYPEKYFTDILQVGDHANHMDQLSHIEATESVTGLRILEVGCSSGDLLCLLRDRGADVSGVEPGDIPRAVAHSIGLDVVARLEDVQGGPFDMVVLFDVLEHLPRPVSTLQWISTRLSPKGQVVVGVPNIESIESQLLRERWFALELPRHLTHFSPAAMERLAGMVGLTLRHTHYPRISYFAKSFVDPRLNGAWFSKTNDFFSRAFRLGLWLVEKTLFQLGNRPCFVAHLEQT